MRPVGRRWRAALVTTLALAPVLAGCGSDGEPTRTIAVLRAVPSAPERQAALFRALDRAGYADVEVLGRDRTEVHPDPADAERTVRKWVADGAEVVVVLSTGSAQAARKATSTVPIVVLSNDPVASGLVRNPRHPEGNVTGSSYQVPADRTLAVAVDAFGEIETVGCLYPAGDPGADPVRRDLERGAAALGMQLRCVAFDGEAGVPAAVEALVTDGVDIVQLLNASGTVQAYGALERALASVSLPVVANTPNDFATLILEPDGPDVYAQLGRQVARLLGGSKVADVPVQDPARFVLVVNTRSARRVGVTIPADVVRRADVVVR